VFVLPAAGPLQQRGASDRARHPSRAQGFAGTSLVRAGSAPRVPPANPAQSTQRALSTQVLPTAGSRSARGSTFPAQDLRYIGSQYQKIRPYVLRPYICPANGQRPTDNGHTAWHSPKRLACKRGARTTGSVRCLSLPQAPHALLKRPACHWTLDLLFYVDQV
jgi:hypothetical protein